LKILVVYDDYIPKSHYEEALKGVTSANSIRYVRLDITRFSQQSESDKSIREFAGDPHEVAASLTDEDILIVHVAPVTDEVLAKSPNLKAVFCARGGPVNIDVASASRRHIAVVSAPGRNADSVADATLAFMLMLSRNFIRAASYATSGQQLTREGYGALVGHELGHKTLGLVGFGNVGARVAMRAIAFGMSVLVYDPFVDQAKMGPDVTKADLDAVLQSSDFISVHARESPDNYDMIGREQFLKMKPSAFFINTARGSLVDEDALLEALVSKKIAGAALDVMKKEPIAPESPLLKLPNVIVTPHIAGASHEVPLRGAEIVGAQVKNWVEGRPVAGLMNPEVLKK
jgi:phosphoglycerate dehydrogenase-like enzyme